MTLETLKRDYDALVEKQEALLANADADQRELTDDESKEFDTLDRSINDLTAKIENIRKQDEARKRIAQNKLNSGNVKRSEEQKVSEKFSFLRVLKNLNNGVRPDQMDGAEGEMHQEAVREAMATGRALQGYGLPSFQLRAQTAGTPATAGNLIATELDDQIIPALRPNLVMSALGATTLNGLVGNLDLPAGDSIASANWETENGEANNTDPSTRLVNLRPNRLAAITTVSKQLMTQASFSVEAWIRGELSNAIARAVDSAAIVGNGGGIDGILATTGVNEVTFGGAVTRDKLIDLMTSISLDDYNSETMAFLVNPILKGEMMQTKLDAGSGQFLMDNANNLFGYPVAVSTLVPTNINSTKTAAIFGDFSNVVLANWGGVEIVVDPYVKAEFGQVRIIINSYWDVELKQPKAFAFGDDITWSAIS
jgi:HK97 family phage major capsid protein